jgi:hypothetical protein
VRLEWQIRRVRKRMAEIQAGLWEQERSVLRLAPRLTGRRMPNQRPPKNSCTAVPILPYQPAPFFTFACRSSHMATCN